jgi:1,4-dihydroxy-2-naphthoate octaprenyltransferase
VIGLLLIALTGAWWLLIVGAACIAAAWFYTGGRRPYGYLGLGEVFVLIFFGIVPVVGTAYVQMSQMPVSAWIAGVGVGLVSCAILVTNNLRDIPSDTASGKITLAVRLGDRGTRVLYICLISAALLAVPVLAGIGVAHVGSASGWWPLLALASFIQAIGPLGLITGGATGRDLVPALKGTGTLLLVYGVLLGLGLALGGVSPSW